VNLFERLTVEALKNQDGLASLRIVVEKELLHHDILRIMAERGFLSGLTFIGGTCLRACYGAPRLSEDLDFTGGRGFDRDILRELGPVLVRSLMEKYSFPVIVSEPVRDEGNVDTWKIRIQTRPEAPNMPAQKIHIDICAVDSYDRQPVLLRNHYGVDMGTFGLVVRAESLRELYADKLIAFAMRPHRVKQRDIWDLYWLEQKGLVVDPALLRDKIEARIIEAGSFRESLARRIAELPSGYRDFKNEMSRFLPAALADRALSQDGYWESLTAGLRRSASEILTIVEP